MAYTSAMSRRITQVTTRGGDSGESSLADGTRLSKTDPRFEAMGTIDELNSHLGVLLAALPEGSHKRLLQQSLFDLGGALAFPGSENFPSAFALEKTVAELNKQLPPLTEFVLPGGTHTCALAHVCRTVCRRAERTMWALPADTNAGAAYLNRLSDYFFVLARTLNNGANEPQWRGPATKSADEHPPTTP